MPGAAAKVKVSEKQWAILDQLRRGRAASAALKQRATIVLQAFEGRANEAIATAVGPNRQQVGLWRRRWRDAWPELCVWEGSEPRRLREAIKELLADAPRPGSPGKLTAAQVAGIVALACEHPQLSGRPITRWTHRELHAEILRRKLAPAISLSHVGRLLRQAAVQPHRNKLWLNTTEKDPAKFQREVETLCQTYLEAPAKAAATGAHTVCMDEATALQALERAAPNQPPQPGRVARQEFEYIRHGTTTLTAGLDVVTGRIVAPTLAATRTEPEFVEHVARTLAADPAGEWALVVDGLNTHASEGLVRFVAERCGVAADLGKKGCAAL